MTTRTTDIRIEITADEIANSVDRTSSHCMIAEAIRAKLPDAINVLVDMTTIRFSYAATDERYIYLTPYRAQQSIIAFDQGWPIKPFRFRLRAPAQIVPRRHEERDRLPRKRPAKTVEMSRDGGGEFPIVMGGDPPPRLPNLAKHRRYGARTFIE